MNILDKYGIKEVADVTLYSIHKKQDGSGDIYYVPALFLDTLKISNTEKTAESVWAEGGISNDRLVGWDHSRQINITLEDALCTPSSLGLCWNGILSADWENAEVKVDSGVTFLDKQPSRLTRFEKVVFPLATNEKWSISKFLPHRDCELSENDTCLTKSSVVDGTNVQGQGFCRNHSYRWRLAIESSVKSLAMIPDRFFDVKGKHYPINYKKPISITTPTYNNSEFSVIYHIGTPKVNDMRPPSVIVIDETDYQKGRHIKMSFIGHYVDNNGNVYDSKQFIALLQERNDVIENYDHLYGGCVIRPCGQKFYINNGDSLSHNFVSNNVENSIEQQFYDSYDSTQNKIPLDNGGYIIIETFIKVDYLINPNEADYLKIIVDENGDYRAELGLNLNVTRTSGGTLVGDEDNYATSVSNIYWEKAPYIDTYQFKGIQMWNKFSSINALIYCLITKYSEDIISIYPVTNFASEPNNFNKNYEQVKSDHLEDKKLEGKLHAYVNPDTMLPYDDDYWFNKGEVFYIQSLTLSTPNKKIKGKTITVKAGQFPGMYMLVGETFIRDRETGEDTRMQLKFPYCKVKSDQTITLEADGEPTTFNLELEVARPENGDIVQLTFYETAPRLKEEKKGCFVVIDGSTEVLSE